VKKKTPPKLIAMCMEYVKSIENVENQTPLPNSSGSAGK
jgi:hypothetical protein